MVLTKSTAVSVIELRYCISFHYLIKCSSVASLLVLGGGGGKPPNVPTEKKKCTCNICVRERAPQKYNRPIFAGLKIHLHTINAVGMVWRYMTKH